MTQQEGPKPTQKKPLPITILDLQYQAECNLDLRMAARDIAKSQGGDTANRDREIRCLELIAEILYTISLDKERYREFALDIRAKYGRWIPPNERGAPAAPPEATEE